MKGRDYYGSLGEEISLEKVGMEVERFIEEV